MSKQKDTSTLPVPRSSFDQYLEEINRFELLTREEEERLARTYRDHGDLKAAQRLVTANLRFVVKMAYEYRRYDIKLSDLIQEGNIGLMRAVSKFDPDRGYRLISYAVWWIRAYMQDYIIRNWSVVKMRSGGRGRSLFFRAQPSQEEKLLLPGASKPTEEPAAKPEVRRALRDFSLDAMQDEDGKRSFLDAIPSPSPAPDEAMGQTEDRTLVTETLREMDGSFNPKERYILAHRMLADEPETLQEIGERFSISRERVRQIEQALKSKIEKGLRRHETFAGR